MRVAVISDIHGNLVALEAVLAAIERDACDRLVCLGDVAATGPQPRECIDRLRSLHCLSVMGNADAWLLDPRPLRPAVDDLRRVEEIDQWCAAQLTTADREYLSGFQQTMRVPLGEGGEMVCFHGSPRSYDEAILSTTPEEMLDVALSGHDAPMMVGGHTHVQMLRRHGSALLLNPGSVGLPYERLGERVRNPPWAEYALISWQAGGLSVELRRVPIDVEAVRRSALESGMPYAEWWAKDWG